jgi:hypothetical protein
MKAHDQTTTAELAYCPHTHRHVSTNQSFAACIAAHECFSDDPCPLKELLKEAPQKLSQSELNSPLTH